ncbi:MAG TPA: PadR family transcriptional regulator [Ktedonobacterales bacterium]|jgi:DNA-binding PadR family transcriptional regulator|nr:PadR family transcriptional regulator [Ktedonobacterales bacterium]
MTQQEMSHHELPVSSYVILGLLATCGPSTPYEMKKLIDGSIGYFWDFPRAQLYVDPERLARQGLLAEERETSGRRRRVYRITAAGEEELRRWLHETTTQEVEMRDAGLLKLYFGPLLSRDDVVALAQRERELHQRRLATYAAIQAEIARDPASAFGVATLRMGVAYEQMSIRFWEDVAQSPPTTPTTPTTSA